MTQTHSTCTTMSGAEIEDRRPLLRIYMPEGACPHTDRLEAHEIDSHIKGRSWLQHEAEALNEFTHADGIPESLQDGRYLLNREFVVAIDGGPTYAEYIEVR